jgi:hypothetical protein
MGPGSLRGTRRNAMFPTARGAVAVAAAFALLLSPGRGRAELERLKPKRVFLASASNPIDSDSAGRVLFAEALVLKGRASCLMIRVSAEVLGENFIDDDNDFVSAAFDVFVDGEAVEPPHPNLHVVATKVLPQIVTFAAHQCGLAAGYHEIVVAMSASDEGDTVSAAVRTLEIVAESGAPTPLVE